MTRIVEARRPTVYVHHDASEVIAIIFLVLLIDEAASIIPSVNWELMNSTIVFNQAVYLRCNVLNTSDQHLKEITKWKVNDEIATYDGASHNISKYKQLDQKHAFILVIYNFSITDLNATYSCSYGFSTYSKILTLKDATSYEIQPSEEPTKTSYNISGTEAMLSILFKDIHPLPDCELVSNITVNVTPLVLTQWKGIVMDVAVIFYQQMTEMNKSEFHIKCKIGVQMYSIILNADTCKDQTESLTTNWSETTVAIVIIIGTLWLILNCICSIIVWRIYNATSIYNGSNRKEKEDDSQMLMRQSENDMKIDMLLSENSSQAIHYTCSDSV